MINLEVILFRQNKGGKVMFKKIVFICFLFSSFLYADSAHTGLTGASIHTVYRWFFADSAARVNQSVTAADTMKLAYQRSDSTSWILVATTGTKWKKIAYASNQNTLTTSTVNFTKIGARRAAPATTVEVSGSSPIIRVSDSVDSFKPSVDIFHQSGGGGVIQLYNAAVDSVTVQLSSYSTLPSFFKRPIAFDSSNTRISKNDSIQLGSGSYLKTYLDTTFYDSLYDNTTYRDRALARIVQIGRVVMLYQPILVGTVSSSAVYLKGIPSKFLPINTINISCPLQDSTTTTPRSGYIEYLGSPGFQMFRDKGITLATGSFVGIRETCISWIH